MRLTTVIAAILVMALCGSRAQAGDTTYGEIQKIDTAKKSLVVAAECECGSGKIIEVTFTLKDSTKVTLDGKSSELAKLKTGDRVEVDYEETDKVSKVVATRDG
jgi:Cu/Ag efflux protein CusF